MNQAEEARHAVADMLNGLFTLPGTGEMENGLIARISSVFPPKGQVSCVAAKTAELYGGVRGLVSPPTSDGVTHGEVLVKGGLRVPVVVIPVDVSVRQLHLLSEAAQVYARYLAVERLGIQLSYVAVHRTEGVDGIESVPWTAHSVLFK